jgi:hypothetical protein
MSIKFFPVKGMYTPPKFGEYFRVAWWVGRCVLRTKWFVVMATRSKQY